MGKMVKKPALISKEHKNTAKPSGSVQVTPAEMKKKLERFALMTKGSNLEPAIKMLENSDEAWFFEALLEGSTIANGYLVPGKTLKKFDKNAEILGLIALVNAPSTARFSGPLKRSNLKFWNL